MKLVVGSLAILSLLSSVHAAYTPKQWAKELKAQTSAFKKTDKDRDEVISEAEFLQLLNAKAKTKEVAKKIGSFAQAALEETADVFFDWFDEDQSGGIDLEEWITARTADPNGDMPSVLDIPGEVIDRNLNGTVTLKEFQWVAQSFVSPTLTKIWHQRTTTAHPSTSGSMNFMGEQAGSSNLVLTVVEPTTVGGDTTGLIKAGSGTLTLGGSSTLGGSGTIAGSLSTTGILTPGTSIENQVTLGSGATLAIELSSSTTATSSGTSGVTTPLVLDPSTFTIIGTVPNDLTGPIISGTLMLGNGGWTLISLDPNLNGNSSMSSWPTNSGDIIITPVGAP